MLVINLKVNIFATIHIAISFEKVTYYTIKYEDQIHTEFEKFVLNHQSNDEIKQEFNDLLALIRRLGVEQGAKPKYFSRHERKTEALPPDWKQLSKQDRRLHVKYQHNLRLYCMRITDEIVFLFNGGVKTLGPITAEECAVVRRHFRNANKLAQTIEEAIKNKEIELNGLELVFDQDYELIM